MGGLEDGQIEFDFEGDGILVTPCLLARRERGHDEQIASGAFTTETLTMLSPQNSNRMISVYRTFTGRYLRHLHGLA